MVIPEYENPMDLFEEWFGEAKKSNNLEPTAMSLATVDEKNVPSVRIVLLKEFDQRGFVFYTNLNSRKSEQLKAHPFASLCFYWPELERQIRIAGSVEGVSEKQADAYFHSRPRESRIGAWASKQSRPLEDRYSLEKRVALFTARYAIGKVPRPDFWSGWRVVPGSIEFWMKKPYRLHERLLYTRTDGIWNKARLYP